MQSNLQSKSIENDLKNSICGLLTKAQPIQIPDERNKDVDALKSFTDMLRPRPMGAPRPVLNVPFKMEIINESSAYSGSASGSTSGSTSTNDIVNIKCHHGHVHSYIRNVVDETLKCTTCGNGAAEDVLREMCEKMMGVPFTRVSNLTFSNSAIKMQLIIHRGSNAVEVSNDYLIVKLSAKTNRSQVGSVLRGLLKPYIDRFTDEKLRDRILWTKRPFIKTPVNNDNIYFENCIFRRDESDN